MPVSLAVENVAAESSASCLFDVGGRESQSHRDKALLVKRVEIILDLGFGVFWIRAHTLFDRVSNGLQYQTQI